MSTPAVNEKVLDARLEQLERARTWGPRVVSKFETFLRTAPDEDLFRANPIAYAAARGVDEREAIDLFLYATKVGLFRMNWELLCPVCGGTVESFHSLGRVHRHFFCALCHMGCDANMDDLIRVSFTVSADARATRFHDPDALPIDDYVFRYFLNPEARFPGGPAVVDALRGVMKIVEYVGPGEHPEFTLDVAPGIMGGHDFRGRGGFSAIVTGAPAADTQHLRVKYADATWEPAQSTLAPGRVMLEIENASSERAALAVAVLPADKQATHVEFAPFLNGNRLLTSQTFRNLFRSETFEGTEAIGVREVTFVFTDLKGSTALYERIGDLRAFSLVQQHFERLARAVADHGGAVVKTIGDAVMAAFVHPQDAVSASLEMLSTIERFNGEQGTNEIVLKIGIHRGASIAVSLNDRADYFGQTVNIAARVQGLAEAEEICITRDVLEVPAAAALLHGRHTRPESAVLKGIDRPVPIVRVTA